MGLFKKKPGLDNLFLQFPDGSEVGSKEDMDRLMSDFTFTPSTLDRWRLQPVDSKATVDASAVLWPLYSNPKLKRFASMTCAIQQQASQSLLVQHLIWSKRCSATRTFS